MTSVRQVVPPARQLGSHGRAAGQPGRKQGRKPGRKPGRSLQPLTIKYCQDDLRIFRVSIALNRFPDQTPHSSWYEEAEKHIPRRTTTTNINPKLNSATDPGHRAATPMLRPVHLLRAWVSEGLTQGNS